MHIYSTEYIWKHGYLLFSALSLRANRAPDSMHEYILWCTPAQGPTVSTRAGHCRT